MADLETDSREAAAKLRISRVKALSNQDVVAVVTYLLARYPDTFPAMLDDALSSVSPKQGGQQGVTAVGVQQTLTGAAQRLQSEPGRFLTSAGSAASQSIETWLIDKA